MKKMNSAKTRKTNGGCWKYRHLHRFYWIDSKLREYCPVQGIYKAVR